MRSIDWRQINWPAVAINSVYVMVLGVAVAFFAQVFGLTQWREFEPAFTVGLALIVVWVSFRVATRAGSQPLIHGLLIGLLVALANLALNYLTVGLGVPEIAGFLIQILAGMIGGRMAQRTLEGPQR
jgi:putative membrane protein (TIGR04086 family)